MLNESPCSPVTCEGGLLWTVQSILTVILCSRLLWLNCWSILISGESAILAMTGGKASLPPSLSTHRGHWQSRWPLQAGRPHWWPCRRTPPPPACPPRPGGGRGRRWEGNSPGQTSGSSSPGGWARPGQNIGGCSSHPSSGSPETPYFTS